jgi:hypothetical protein
VTHIELHVVIYLEIFILRIREPLANTGQLCTTISHLWDVLYWMTDGHTFDRLVGIHIVRKKFCDFV